MGNQLKDKRNSKTRKEPTSFADEVKETMVTASLMTKKRFGMPLSIPRLFKCLNSQCAYYTKRHRRFMWFSKTKIKTPTCPKCFSHKTRLVTEQEAREMGI